MILTSCNKANNQKTDRLGDMKVNMSYQALSSIKLLKNESKAITSKKLSSSVNQINQEEKAIIDKYLAMMEELLNDNGGFKTDVKESDKEEYTNLILITTSNIANEKIVYSLYYNETFTKTKEEIDDDDKEIETFKKISGIAIVDDEQFTLDGVIEESQEDGETETSSTFKIIKDENNYVIVEEEKEQELNEYEHGYKYVVVTNGKKVNEVEFEIEQEKGKLSIELEEKTANAKTSYKFTQVKIKGSKYFKIEVKNGKEITKIFVRAIYDTNTSSYTYEYKYLDNN